MTRSKTPRKRSPLPIGQLSGAVWMPSTCSISSSRSKGSRPGRSSLFTKVSSGRWRSRHDLEQLAGLRLDALGGVDDHHRAVDRVERAVGVFAEVLVARRVEQRDVAVAAGRSRGRPTSPRCRAHAPRPSSRRRRAKPQRDIPTASVDVANHGYSASKIATAGKSEASFSSADQAKSPVGVELGDSFHFKNGTDNTSSDMYDLQQLSQRSGKTYGDGQHAVAREAPEPVQDADQIDISSAHYDHSGHANLHAAHDLIV